MGWRAFWSELVIVVLGVVIALAANEAAETWNWHGQVRDGQVRLQRDVDSAFFWLAEHYVTEPCVDAQIDALSRRLMASGATLEPAPEYADAGSRYVVRIPYRPYRFSTWNALVANGTAIRFSPAQQNFYNDLGAEMARMRARTDDASILSGRLVVLATPLPLDAGARRDLLVDLEELRTRYLADSHRALQRLTRIRAAGAAPAAGEVDAFLSRSSTARFCTAHGLPMGRWRDVLANTDVGT